MRFSSEYRGGRQAQSGNNVAEISTEEPVAVCRLDAFGEGFANLLDRIAVSAADGCRTTLIPHPGHDRAFAGGQPAETLGRLFAGRFQCQ